MNRVKRGRGYYRYPRYHGALTHPVSWKHKFFTPILLPLGIIIALAWIVGAPLLVYPALFHYASTVFSATLATLGRMTIAYIISLGLSVPMALLITKNARVEKIFLPVVDVLESIPILAFFPVIIVIFIKSHFLEGAAIFVLAISMLWNILFALVGGLKLVPEAINEVTQVYKISGWLKLRSVTIPAMFPELVTGSILAVADGWNIIVVAEVLHTYVAGGTASLDLFGLGSLLVGATSLGNTALFLAALSAMIIVIAIINVFVWQKLLRLSAEYRFD